MSLVVDELLTVPGHMNSPPVSGWNHFAQLLVFCVMFCTSLFVFLFMKIYRCKWDRSRYLSWQVISDSYSLVFVQKTKYIFIASFIYAICDYLCMVVSNTYCVVFFVLFVFVLCFMYPISPVSLDCPFLIAPSVFSNVFLIRIIIFMTSYIY